MIRERFVDNSARLLLVILIVTTCVQPAELGAQGNRYDGQPIVEIEYSGLQSLPEDTMNHYLFGAARDGVRYFDQEALNDRVKRLWQRELIEDIRISVEPSAGGVKLIVQVEERPILASIEYVGIKRVSRTDIIEQIDRERIAAYEGQPLQFGELERLKLAIQELYKEKGYRFAEVTYTLEEISTGHQRATFTIDEGDKVKIGDISFDGNTVFGDWRLRLAMRGTKESGLISRIAKKDIYNPAKIEEDLDKVRELYRKEGFKDVLIDRPELDVRAKRPQAPTIKEQKRRLAITIPVEEGERWRLGEVSIEGNEVFSDELLLRQFVRPRGGWLRSKVIDEAIEKIEKLYKSIGYIFSEVDTELREKEEQTADVIVHVREQDQYRVGRIEFEGNTKTRDKVLRRELMLQEGTVMNMTAVENSLLKIRQLNYFALDEEEPVKFDFDSEDKTVDLVVTGTEAERTELQFGGGWSEYDGFFGQFAMRTTNFLGRGETLGASIQAGGRRDLYNLEYQIPWFLDRPQHLGVQIYKQDYDYRVLTDVNYRTKYAGASVSYGRSFRGFQQASITYAFSDIDYFQELININGESVTAEYAYQSSSIRPMWMRNTLDSRFEPTRGLMLTGSVEVAGGFLGGDTDFVRPRFTATWFRPISRQPFKSSFGVNFEGGLISEFGDGTLYTQQLFYLGGGNSVRGFRTRTIMVRDEDGNILYDRAGFPLGGHKMLQLNLEYHIILSGPFRVVLFADTGGVFGEDQSVDLDLMRYSAGAELRITVPMFPAPLRFIYSSNLDPMPEDRFETFDFSLTTSF